MRIYYLYGTIFILQYRKLNSTLSYLVVSYLSNKVEHFCVEIMILLLLLVLYIVTVQ